MQWNIIHAPKSFSDKTNSKKTGSEYNLANFKTMADTCNITTIG